MEDQNDWHFNVNLAKSRGLDAGDMYALQSLYTHMHQILMRPNMHVLTPRDAVKVVEGLEYSMQLIWKFPLDSSFHNYWFELNGCSCPVMDNRERSGTLSKIITCNCPFHGDNIADTWDDRRFK